MTSIGDDPRSAGRHARSTSVGVVTAEAGRVGAGAPARSRTERRRRSPAAVGRRRPRARPGRRCRGRPRRSLRTARDPARGRVVRASTARDDVPAPVVLSDVARGEPRGPARQRRGGGCRRPRARSGGDVTLRLDLPGGARIRVQADASSLVAIVASSGVAARYRLRRCRRPACVGRGPPRRLSDLAPRSTTTSSSSPGPTPSPSATPRPSRHAGWRPAPSGPASSIHADAIPVGPGRARRQPDRLGHPRRRRRPRPGRRHGGHRLAAVRRRTWWSSRIAPRAIEIRLPAATGTSVPAARCEVVGRAGRSYGAPRIVATEITRSRCGHGPGAAHADRAAERGHRMAPGHASRESFRSRPPHWCSLAGGCGVARHDVSRQRPCRREASRASRVVGGGDDPASRDRQASLPDRQGPPVRDPAAVGRRRRGRPRQHRAPTRRAAVRRARAQGRGRPRAAPGRRPGRRPGRAARHAAPTAPAGAATTGADATALTSTSPTCP